MESMFNTTNLFNNGDTGDNGAKPFTNWEAPLCTTFVSMFQFALVFNQEIPKLVNTSGVASCLLSFMFNGASIFNNGDITNAFSKPMISWNTTNVTSMANMFQSAVKFNQQLYGLNWNTQNVKTIASMFQSATIFNNGDPAGSSTKPLNFNTTNVTTMSATFVNAVSFNQPINTSGSYWNTGNVTTMFQMFGSATLFNQPIGNWDVSKVTSMFQMFYNANAFNQPIGSWNTVSVTTMGDMFRTTSVNTFNQNIGSWNTSNVTIMSNMFNNAKVFNQNISSWNTGNVTTMASMFNGATIFNNGSATNDSANLLTWSAPLCTSFASMFQSAVAFNQDISNLVKTSDLLSANCTLLSMFQSATLFNKNISSWNTSKVNIMTSMFQSASAFNNGGSANINNWNTSNVTNMSSMFSSAFAFNQPIGSWNTSNVTTMASMFSLTRAFNQNIGSWNTSNVTNMSSMFLGSTTLALTTIFNNGEPNGLQNVPTVTAIQASYATATNTLTCPGATLLLQSLSAGDTIVVSTSTTVYSSTIQNLTNTTIVFNALLHTANIAVGSIVSVKKSFAGGAPLNWNTSKVTTMANMFQYCISFNQNITTSGSIWNTSLVTTVISQFQGINATTGKGLFNNGQVVGGTTAPMGWTFNVVPTSTNYRTNSNLTSANKPGSLV
jgi:surface protein